MTPVTIQGLSSFPPEQRTQGTETSPASPSEGNAPLMQLPGKPPEPDELAERSGALPWDRLLVSVEVTPKGFSPAQNLSY